ncbi:DUF362 domain-containing protein, partial [Candidatus Pacearchaeota archaeon]|nr:DUF362 domain-containing protein [Candidatus Pacearchaeota archaeon]
KKGVTTNLELLEFVVNELKTITPRVKICESESEWRDIDEIFDNLNISCDTVNLSELDSLEIVSSYGKIQIPKIPDNTHIINIPILKSHDLTKVSIGIKNLFGFIQTKEKSKFHSAIDEVLIDIRNSIKPKLNLLDCSYYMDGNGPKNGAIKKGNFLIYSNSVESLDYVACKAIGIDPFKIPHIRNAIGKEYENIKIEIENPKLFPIEFFNPYINDS